MLRCCFEDGSVEPWSKERRQPLEVTKTREWILYERLQKEPALLTLCLQVSRTDLGLLTSATVG